MEFIVLAVVIFVVLALTPTWASDPKTMAKAQVILRDYYLKGMAEALRKSTVLLSRIDKQAPEIDAGGRKWGLQVESKPNEAVAARAEQGTLPEPSHAGEDEVFWYPGHIYGSFSITGQVLDAAARNPGAIINELDRQTKSLKRSIRRYVNWALYRDGSGLLGTCISASNSTTIVLSAQLHNDGAKHCRPGQKVSVLLKSSGAVNGVGVASAKITSVNKTTHTIVIDTALAAFGSITTSYGVYLDAGRNLWPYGLQAVHAAGNPSAGTDPNGYYGALDRTTAANYWWCGNELTNPAGAGTARPLVMDLILEALDTGEGDEGDITAGYMGDEVWRAVANIIWPMRNWQGQIKRLDMGIEYFEHNGVAFIKDRVCPNDQILFVPEKELVLLQNEDYGALDHDGMTLRMGSRVDEWIHDGVWRLQLACRRPNVGVILKDLAVRTIPTQS